MWDNQKHYGLVRPATGGDDIFFHKNDAERNPRDLQSLRVGNSATFAGVYTNGKQKPQARGVRIVHAEPATEPASPRTVRKIREERAAVAEQVREMQRQGGAAKSRWDAFLNVRGIKMRDPRRHSITRARLQDGQSVEDDSAH